MDNDKYRRRFIAEYREMTVRHKRHCDLLTQYEHGTLEDELPCSFSLLAEQCTLLGRYIGILKLRAKAEDIEL